AASLEHCSKALAPMELNTACVWLSSTISVIPSQLKNASSPIFSNVDGNTIDVSPSQPLKALLPISSRPSERVSEAIL
ncbi:MAG: hypothetical protein MJ144_05455, partial [Clostridia bacterium]|nr:hypothetical protein [Clostridia bacterium]